MGILFLTVVSSAAVAKLEIPGILPLISFISVLRVVLVTKILALYTYFSAAFLSTTLLSFFRSTGTSLNLSASNWANLSISAFDFKLGKSSFLANCDVSTPVVFFKSDFEA